MASIDNTNSPVTQLARDRTPRGRVGQIQRARMLSAAIDAIERNGYANLTVMQVIERAKVSRKTFYDLFEDREDCFLAIFQATLAQLSVGVTRVFECEPSWRDGVRASLAALLTFIDESPELARLCVVDALAAGPQVLAERSRVLASLSAVLDRARELPGARPDPPAVTAEGVIGAVLAVLHARLLDRSPGPYLALHGALMSMIVLPYLGTSAARREMTHPASRVSLDADAERALAADPMAGLKMRLTYRTVRVLGAIGERPGSSNREIAHRAGVVDQGQISKLLSRLESLGLIENVDGVPGRGAPNEWRLTARGEQVERATHPM